MIYRLSIAYLEPADLADRLARRGLAGTVVAGIGFTPEWGREPSAVAVLAGADRGKLIAAARAILAETGEEAAYLDDGSTAWLVWGTRVEEVA